MSFSLLYCPFLENLGAYFELLVSTNIPASLDLYEHSLETERGMIYIIRLGIKIHYNGRITHTYALGGVAGNLIFRML